MQFSRPQITKGYELWKDETFQRRTVFASLLFSLSVVINYYASTYATRVESNPVTDIILSNTTARDVDGIFIQGALLLIAFILLLCLARPRRIPFVLLSIGTFIATRAVFISLTHIGPFPEQIAFDVGRITSKLVFGGDLFFSGHTGIPFLMALVFWRERLLRYLFLVSTLIFATAALLGHIHYSIDVLSAFYITYTIYHICSYLFPREKELLSNPAY